MGAIAQTQQAISRAVAQVAAQGLFPACDMASRLSRRRRLHFAACLDAAGATPWPGLGFLGWRVDIGTCHDASTSARLTWEFPARVIPPRDSVSPLERIRGREPAPRGERRRAREPREVARLGGEQERGGDVDALHQAQRVCIWSSKSFRNGKRSFPIW